MAKSHRFPRLRNVQLFGCYIRLTLDTRHKDKRPDDMPVSIVFQQGNDRAFFALPYRMSAAEYEEVCRSTGRGKNAAAAGSPFAIRTQIESSFDDVLSRLSRQFQFSATMTPQSAIRFLSGLKEVNTVTLMSLWDEVAAAKSVTTRNSYLSAKKSFVRLFGERSSFVVTSDELREWMSAIDSRSKRGRKTTSGIYSRALRVVLNEAIARHLLPAEAYPFGKNNGVKIPRGGLRKEQYLDVSKMTELYLRFVESRYPETWTEQQILSVSKGVGLFLAQYLCNGCNLRDLAQLRYNEHYFASGGRSFSFIRQKTADRNDTDQEVVIPITEHLATVLERIAAAPVPNGLVFPQILGDVSFSDEDAIVRRVAQANQNVRKQVRKLTDDLGWPVQPSGSWCRHSFMTNLTHKGVPPDYVHQSVGHSIVVTDITQRYIEQYPLDQQLAYNSLLINSSAEASESQLTVNAEEYAEFLRWKNAQR